MDVQVFRSIRSLFWRDSLRNSLTGDDEDDESSAFTSRLGPRRSIRVASCGRVGNDVPDPPAKLCPDQGDGKNPSLMTKRLTQRHRSSSILETLKLRRSLALKLPQLIPDMFPFIKSNSHLTLGL